MLWCFNSVYFVTPLKNCDPIVSWKVQFSSSMEGLFEEQNSWDVFCESGNTLCGVLLLSGASGKSLDFTAIRATCFGI